jgi:hypothetical protein
MIALLIPIFLVLFIISGEAVAEEELACTTDIPTEKNIMLSKIGTTFSDKETVQFMKLQAEDDHEKSSKHHLDIKDKIDKLLTKVEGENRYPIKLTDEQKHSAKNYIRRYIDEKRLGTEICTDKEFINSTLKALPYANAIEVFRFIIEAYGKQCSKCDN